MLRTLICLALCLPLLGCFGENANVKNEVNTIKIGDISPYTGLAYYAEPYKRGWQLALKEVNEKGGVCLKSGVCYPLEVISRDSRANPADAIQAAQDLILTENVFALMGPIMSHVGLAISEITLKQKIPFITAIAGTDKLLWSKGHDYVFRVNPGATEMIAHLGEHLKEKKHLKRWAIVVENYEAGHAYGEAFIANLKKHIPDVQIVMKQYPALNKIEAGVVVQALKKENPDGAFVFLLGPNMSNFLRELRTRKIGETIFFSAELGFPEDYHRYGSELPQGWYVVGLPSKNKAGKAYQTFYENFEKEYGEGPSRAAVLGYALLKSFTAALGKINTLERENFLKALKTPLFPFMYDEYFIFRKEDHQSNLHFAIGKTAVKDGVPMFVQTKAPSLESIQVSEEWIKKQRKDH